MKETYKGYTISIEHDDSALNPRDIHDNLGIFLLSHRRYTIANETTLSTKDYNSWNEVEKAINREHGKSFILPVYMYDHSGLALNTTGFSCQWDSGQLGFIFVPYTKIREGYDVKHVTKKVLEKVSSCLNNEVKIYGAYLNGEVYGYVILDPSNEEKDSSWGFYGDHEESGLLECAKEEIDGYLELA